MHTVEFIYTGLEEIDTGMNLLERLQRRETHVLKSRQKIQVVQELNVCERHSHAYMYSWYNVDMYYPPIDGAYNRWLNDRYKEEIKAT